VKGKFIARKDEAMQAPKQTPGLKWQATESPSEEHVSWVAETPFGKAVISGSPAVSKSWHAFIEGLAYASESGLTFDEADEFIRVQLHLLTSQQPPPESERDYGLWAHPEN
jgi:hypothetical protein